MKRQVEGSVDRRQAIASLGAMFAAGVGLSRQWPAALTPSPGAGAMPVDRPGVQLYTVRREMERSVEATLARVAEIGYREVEFAGLFDRPAADVGRLLAANGLTAPAMHIGLDRVRGDWDRTIDDASRLGAPALVVPSIPSSERSVEGYKRLAAEFNKAGESARARGLSFAYHNHDFEFARLGDTTGHAILLRECDPGLVSFELDLFWITKAGVDAAGYVAAHPGRFPLVHVKDMAADGSMTEVGRGVIDFQRIFTAARGTIRHYFVEHDNPADPFGSITTSLASLRQYTTGNDHEQT